MTKAKSNSLKNKKATAIEAVQIPNNPKETLHKIIFSSFIRTIQQWNEQMYQVCGTALVQTKKKHKEPMMMTDLPMHSCLLDHIHISSKMAE